MVLARGGIIEKGRFDATVDLAWPRIVTGFAIMSKRTVDLVLVGWAVGSVAVAGLTLANAFWLIGKFVGIGVAGGTLTFVSQNYGAEDAEGAALAVNQSVWIALALSVPVAGVFVAGAQPLIALVGSDPSAIRYGVAYLTVAAPALVFEYQNLIASRTYAGAGDTVTPMVVRSGAALLNIVLSTALVFGAGLGVVGAALGTTLATAAATLVFAWGMSGRSYWGRGSSPVVVTEWLPQYHATQFRELVGVMLPLIGRRVVQGLFVFPFLAIASAFGPVAVAAVGVGRQVRGLLNSFSWGFSIATSTLVGQELGSGDEDEATAYSREITRLSAVIYVLAALLVVALATPVATLFVETADEVALTATFVRASAISAVTLGIDGTLTGVLRGAGDTQIPFWATLVGKYACALPVAWVGTVTGLGIELLLAALVLETLVPMAINHHRVRSGTWKSVSRTYRSAGD